MVSLKRKQQGFTIVELLIVIIVIGILAALVLVTFKGVQQKARNTERQTDTKAVASHLETYNADADHGYYPTDSDMNTAAFISGNLKGLDPASTCDPKASGSPAGNDAASPPCAFVNTGSGSTSNQYGYHATKDDGTACTNAAGDECTKFTLTYTEEGGSQKTITNL